ncbi:MULTISPECIES: SlyX family protein [Halomonas]|uniref:SlyX family protein n=1 Tax=Halomonas TaxID=2745 RepID=UPI000ED87FCE|nr:MULTISPECIES: SlyX family protein [Halomonas]HCR99004.1 slyX [Halomonas sp.]
MTQDFSPAELNQLFENLESRLAYQEHWLDTLDQAVAQQEKRLAKLEQLSALMRERLREQHQAFQAGDHQGESRPEDEVPPHY